MYLPLEGKGKNRVEQAGRVGVAEADEDAAVGVIWYPRNMAEKALHDPNSSFAWS
jgi:hypothetical protein